ncbi:M20 family metallopeptidase [Aspergillus brunneoviolaceus CBS 621.78]|uniref:Amidohydrolase n=1 Tax=Aspergillus brunneoviolaceus CBS 621.78 TaxID=1450534 RepID=A0ACD1G6H1_9EURO|nr:putative amidohydrolase [Aspergillus brunneoviolaceus CBS 621.78]RAH44848.1 putative amidohydrolase [Aspergillus brunneoviolaceus CBS 621.78]
MDSTSPALSPTEAAQIVDATLDSVSQQLRDLNHQIWSHPEAAFTEHHAHDILCTFLETQPHPFVVTRQAYGLATAFEAVSETAPTQNNTNHDEPPTTINFNAEYDALPGIGHACGHNLIATSSVAAFLALSALLRHRDIRGRAQLLGTPAEENGGGKVKLLRAGAYDGVAISLMGHGGPTSLPSDGVAGMPMTARQQLTIEFRGAETHAGATPWEGRNALDALVSAYNNVSLLRQQLRPEERIHCAILETPTVANVIPAATKACWQVRSPSRAGLRALVSRVRRCVEAGALAAGCEAVAVEEEDGEAYTDVLLNETLCRRYQAHMKRYGREVVVRADEVLAGSTDAGNVSYVLPTLHSFFSISAPPGCVPHHPSYTEAAGSDIAHQEAIRVGKALALLGWDMITNPELLEQARAELREGLLRAQ